MKDNEKQALEAMVKDVVQIHRDFLEDDDYEFLDDYLADKLFHKGYRKQSEGEWIAKKEMYRTPSARNYYCSNCEKNAPFDSFMGVSRITNYCPNCGARMKGGAE